MKKLLLFIILISFSLKTKAQVVFCPPGAKWHYAFTWSINGWYTENFSISYSGDTIVANDTLKILTPAKFYKRQNCKLASRTLIKQKGDTIYMSNDKTQHSWQILYNFGAAVGHSWQTTFLDAKNISVTYTITVDSVANVQVNNFQLKCLYVKYWANGPSGPGYALARITERLGCNAYLFNYTTQICISDADRFDKFLCYTDSDFGNKQFTDTACDYSGLSVTGINELFGSRSSLVIYPNPVKDFLNIEINEINAENFELSLSDLQGSMLKKIPIKENEKIDLGDLKSGMYLIILTRDKEVIYKEKLIKE